MGIEQDNIVLTGTYVEDDTNFDIRLRDQGADHEPASERFAWYDYSVVWPEPCEVYGTTIEEAKANAQQEWPGSFEFN